MVAVMATAAAMMVGCASNSNQANDDKAKQCEQGKCSDEAKACNENVKQLVAANSLEGWEVLLADETVKPEEVYSVKDGVVRAEGKPFGVMYTKEQYGDYRLHVEWRYPDTTGCDPKWINSGIFLHVQPSEKVWPTTIECQLCSGKAGDFVLINGSELAQYQVPAGQERPQFPVIQRMIKDNESAIGEWNTAEITCTSDTIRVDINGQLQNYGTGAKHTRGSIGLQSEGCPIEFRNVTLEQL